MYSEPCARFTRFMMPSTSVSPAAIRNSMTPSCTPFSNCSKKRMNPMRKKRAGYDRPFAFSARALPLHLAFLVVRVLVLVEHFLLDVHLHAVRSALGRLEQVERLDGMVVVVELEVAAQRLEVRLAQLRHHGLGVLDVALH